MDGGGTLELETGTDEGLAGWGGLFGLLKANRAVAVIESLASTVCEKNSLYHRQPLPKVRYLRCAWGGVALGYGARDESYVGT